MPASPTPDPLERLVEALGLERAAREALDARVDEANALLDASREAGHTWAAISAATGESESSLQWRLARSRVEDDARELSAPPSPAKSREGVPQPGSGPEGTVTVTEAARKLGLSRQSVYQWIASGRLDAVMAVTGRQRVTLASIERALELQGAAPPAGSMSVEDAAKKLRVSRATVYRLISEGLLGKAGPGRVSSESVTRFLEG